MSWREEIEPDWFYEAPFYLTAIIAHGALLTLNPVINWGSAKRALDKVVPIEFVAEIPLPPSLNLAPSPGGDGTNAPPHHGPGQYEPAKAKPKPLAKPAVDARAVKFAREAQATSKRLRTERDRAIGRESAASTRRRDAADRAARAAVARAEAERRAEAAERRAAALVEQRRVAAEANAARTAKRAELSSALATMADPDEALEAAPVPPASGRGSTRKAAAAAALAESADPGDAAGDGGVDLLDSKARGGGIGPESDGVHWSVDGPVGNRRILTRVSPTSPDWVAIRNLDLTVTIRFHVLPDGSVAPGAVISKTSGFPEIDRLALDALRRWRFQSVPDKAGTPEVWGRVTFRFIS